MSLSVFLSALAGLFSAGRGRRSHVEPLGLTMDDILDDLSYGRE